MPTAHDFVTTALSRKGARYIYASEASPLDPSPDAFDCSELVQWAADRVHIVPSVPDGSAAQHAHCARITVNAGIHTYGALLFLGNPVHHVAISLGDGTTIEARGRAYGVGVFSATRGFTSSGLIPGLTYSGPGSTLKTNQGGGLGIWPGAPAAAVKFLQNMLNICRAAYNKNHSPDKVMIAADGNYGNQTKAAVLEFQREWNHSVFGGLFKVPETMGCDSQTGKAISIIVNIALQG
jgi:hypothetical protein